MDDSDQYKRVLDNLFDGVYLVDRERRITYWNKGAERISGYTATEVIGSRCQDNILNHVDESGRRLCEIACPLTACMQDGGLREDDVFLHHRDGQRVPVTTRVAPLRDRDDAIVGAIEVFNENSAKMAMRREIQQLQELSHMDALTQVFNRRRAEMHLEASMNEARRFAVSFGILLIDIDHFKAVNDTHGHNAGDAVLKMVAKTLANNVRSLDSICRWGGEEFIGIIGHMDSEQLLRVAEKLRTLVEQSFLMIDGKKLRVTISVGATLAAPGERIEDIVQRADSLMYQSKQAGRNRVTLG